jgi:hypothetical protein
MGSARCAILGCCIAALSCADDPRTRGPGVPPAFGSPLPLPGCEALELEPCDVHARDCVENLAQVAVCMRTGGTREPSPPVVFASEQEARQTLRASLEQSPPPQPNHFEIVLTQLGLTERSAFEPEVTATRLAQRWAAFYRRDVDEVVVIEHGAAAALEPIALDALVLHELIHALQDREHDLDAFAIAYETDSDGTLRGSSLIEGEAQLHQQRFAAALSGRDVTAIDWPRALEEQREAAEQALFRESDLYSASLLSVPYAHGAAYVEQIWSQSGAAGVRALFSAPPRDMREILGTLWGDTTPARAASEPAPAALPDATLEAWSTLGAWGVYLLARPKLETTAAARELALAWRGDRLEAYSFGDRQTAGRWSIELADELAAARLVAALAHQPALRARQRGTQVLLLSSSTEPVPASLAQ